MERLEWDDRYASHIIERDRTVRGSSSIMPSDSKQTAPGLLRRPDALAQGYIFDLDGTIYLGGELLPGAKRLIESLIVLDREILFLSNNPTSSPADYVAKLARLGIPATPERVLNTVDTMTAWLVRHHPEATVFPISEQPLKDALAVAGIRMSEDPTEIDIVIASYDRSFDYRKLQIAFDAIRTYGRAFLVTTNPDRFCPFPGGHGEPDAAAVIGAIEGCTGTTLRQNTGKPDRFMLEAALDRLKLDAGACIMIGDRLMTDIRMAIDAGMPSALVLTGETTLDMLQSQPAENHPTWVIERVDEVLPQEFWERHGWTTSDE
jgi:HAD superfamily hydrolase (TIGR01450 family)